MEKRLLVAIDGGGIQSDASLRPFWREELDLARREGDFAFISRLFAGKEVRRLAGRKRIGVPRDRRAVFAVEVRDDERRRKAMRLSKDRERVAVSSRHDGERGVSPEACALGKKAVQLRYEAHHVFGGPPVEVVAPVDVDLLAAIPFNSVRNPPRSLP